MSEITITTPRGIRLSGTINAPVDSNGSIVIFVHDFLSERSGGYRYDIMAAAFRRAGYTTLQFDFSGVGESEDDVITLAGSIEDLRSVCAWANEQGYSKQFVVATAFGSLVALSSDLDKVKSIILIDPMITSVHYEWESIFPAEQLEKLDKDGVMRVFDDSPTSRKYFIISKQTLADLSLTNIENALEEVKCPILILVTDYENYNDILIEFTGKYFSKLSDGSKVDVIRDESNNLKNLSNMLAEASISWCELRSKNIS
ncbi:alpha/beta hydrolase [Actinomyces sp. zg-332]|uniref:alpha/beta hydrolase n=1 Tax=Actinomyces sp. zg-332 TaxID=2708340 RepID=UPI00141DB70A|nr:alpha/beta hydrolase [Actinomyces sp. zg-332]QPK94079.1 alpha/beta hydrolase [Actinomyces sp. zg-332]